MRVQDFIKMPKAITKAGKWKTGKTGKEGRMNSGSFALSARRPYILGSAWHWHVDELDCEGTKGRLLVAFRPDTENYQAWLAIENEKSLTVVACLEFHGDHPGWHWHSRCAHVEEFTHTCHRQRNGGLRFPGKGRPHRRQGWEMSETRALEKAYKAFRVGARQEGEML